MNVPCCPKVIRLLGKKIRVDDKTGSVVSIVNNVATVEVYDES